MPDINSEISNRDQERIKTFSSFDPSEQNNSSETDELDDVLTWEDSYAIALTLRKLHPAVAAEELSLLQIYHWTVELPNFSDDPALANQEILTAIVSEWFEEANPL